MLTIEEALESVLSIVSVLGSDLKPLGEALGQVLDEDVSAGFDIPPFPNSAMDGYAVRAADTTGARPHQPRLLRVIDEAAAGRVCATAVTAGTAVRIMTGAAMPAGADSVVRFEDTDEERDGGSGSIRIFKEASPGLNVRPSGEDVYAGELVVKRGTVLRPAEIAVLASLGRASVRVIRRPTVAVLSTGDELLAPGRLRTPGKIYDANGYGIAALVARFGGLPKPLGIAADSREELTERIRAGLDADLMVTSAGVSRGDYDLVKEVLAREGQIEFCSVAMKPGKPLAFGSFERDGRKVPHLGLPGNPVSAMIAFELFGRPLIMKMMGKSDARRPMERAMAMEPFSNGDCERTLLARCVVTDAGGRWHASLAGGQGSGMLTSLMRANALAILGPNEHVEKGEELNVLLLDHSRGEEWGSYRQLSCEREQEDRNPLQLLAAKAN